MYTTVKTGVFVCLFVLQILPASLWAQDTDAVALWTLDHIQDSNVLESVSEQEDAVSGNYRLVRGAKGQAIVMDGYTTCITRPAQRVPQFGQAFTIEAWVALGAYPWNWAPVAAQENTVSAGSNTDTICWPEDITTDSPREGFFFGISAQGYLGLHIGSGDDWTVCRSEKKLTLHAWTHIAATYDGHGGITLYMGGQEAGRLKIKGRFQPADTEDLRIGMARQKIEAAYPVRAFATLPCWYALDGLVDELSLSSKALSQETIQAHYASTKAPASPDLPKRVMPSGPAGPGKFGASYMSLKYTPEWDALWRLSADPDIVIQFDDSPVRVVFWRGTRYGPAWVMENGMWMCDQSIENFNGQDGCIEHMLDPRCRMSHVRIIENTPARVVVHWRYCPTSANGNHSQVNAVSGWEDWVDEYYTFYPDQVGVRNVILHSEGVALWPEEVIVLCQPGQRPEDVVDLSALTLANLHGEQHTYTWADKSPRIRSRGRRERGGYIHFSDTLGEKPNIMMVNFKSQYKPFQIFELECNFTVFAHEHRKEVSRFPWWNHWPAALIPSDGRYCQAADRPSHFSLAWASPRPHRMENNRYRWTWMYGATKEDIASKTSLARSWVAPAELAVDSGASEGQYDSTQRCYVMSRSDRRGANPLQFTLKGSPESPVVNPAFVVRHWGDHEARVTVNGKHMSQGRACRVGRIRRLNQYDLVVWLELESEAAVHISMDRQDQASR